jgi:hypothetical protein
VIDLEEGSLRKEPALIQRVDRLGDVYDAADRASDAAAGAERLFELRRQEVDDYLIDFMCWLVRRVEIANVVADRSIVFADRDDAKPTEHQGLPGLQWAVARGRRRPPRRDVPRWGVRPPAERRGGRRSMMNASIDYWRTQALQNLDEALEARDKLFDIQRGVAALFPLVCAYCDWILPPPRPDDALDLLREHVEIFCPNHPMRRMISRLQELYALAQQQREAIDALMTMLKAPVRLWDGTVVEQETFLCGLLLGEGDTHA